VPAPPTETPVSENSFGTNTERETETNFAKTTLEAVIGLFVNVICNLPKITWLKKMFSTKITIFSGVKDGNLKITAHEVVLDLMIPNAVVNPMDPTFSSTLRQNLVAMA
jgi:hypothetical protein